MGFLRRFIDFVAHPTRSRTMGILIFFFLVTAVVLTVIVSQQQQQIRQRASDYCADTEIDDCPPAVIVTPGDDCAADPGFKCRIGNNIYECASVQKNNNNDFN